MPKQATRTYWPGLHCEPPSVVCGRKPLEFSGQVSCNSDFGHHVMQNQSPSSPPLCEIYPDQRKVNSSGSGQGSTQVRNQTPALPFSMSYVECHLRAGEFTEAAQHWNARYVSHRPEIGKIKRSTANEGVHGATPAVLSWIWTISAAFYVPTKF